jgi:hypothetical protein
MKTLPLYGLLALATSAHADSFEARAQNAVKIRLDDLVWAVTTTCDKADDTQTRQCKQVRDKKLKALAGATLLVEGSGSAFELGPWDAAKKSVSVKLVACIDCEGFDVDGKRWHVVGTNARVDGGKLRGAVLHDTAKVFPDQAAAEAWTKPLTKLRVEYVGKLGARAQTQVGGKAAIQLEVTAWRVVNVCDGSIVVSSQPSGPTAPATCN